MSNSFHIVQVGLDEDVFDEKAAQDSRARQISYAQKFKKNNNKIHLTNIVLTQNASLEKEELEDVTFIPCLFFRLRHIPSLTKFLNKFGKENKVLIVTTQDIHGIFWGAVLFSFLEKVPVIGQVHYDLSSPSARKELFEDLYGRLYEWFALRLIKLFDGIRVVNNATKIFIENTGYKKPVLVSPVPVTTYMAKGDETVKKWNYQGTLRVLFVGRLVQAKNLDCWIETARATLLENKNLEFAMIGEGAERKRIEQYADDCGIRDRIQFVGALQPETLASWYASADVLLLTSSHEGFGRVIVEAMNYNVVPVSTNVAGPGEIIKNTSNGFLEEADPELLAKHLIYLEENRDILKTMGSRAKETVLERYSPEKLQDKWVDFVSSFIKNLPDN
ncbi:MAG: glycosyltransferase family 4 protein [Candidatus Scalindua sp.]